MTNNSDGIFDALLPSDSQEQPEVSAEVEQTEVETTDAVDTVEDVDTESVEEVEEVESEDSEAEDTIYEIEGEKYTLTELQELKQSGLRQADYTKKTQEISTERKEVKALKAQQSEKLESLDSKIADVERLIVDQESTINWDDLRDEDPSEYLRQQELLAKRKEAIEAAKIETQKIKDDEFQEIVIRERELLLEAMPEWADEATLQADSEAMSKYFEENGFGEDDTKDLTNHRLYIAINKAAKYDALQDKAAATEKKVKKAPKVVKAKKTAKQSKGAADNPFNSLANALYN